MDKMCLSGASHAPHSSLMEFSMPPALVHATPPRHGALLGSVKHSVRRRDGLAIHPGGASDLSRAIHASGASTRQPQKMVVLGHALSATPISAEACVLPWTPEEARALLGRGLPDLPRSSEGVAAGDSPRGDSQAELFIAALSPHHN